MNGSQKLDVVLKSSLEKWPSNGGPLSFLIMKIRVQKCLWKYVKDTNRLML